MHTHLNNSLLLNPQHEKMVILYNNSLLLYVCDIFRWGGCIVALCHYNEAVAYVEMLKNNFYSKHSDIRNRNINDLVFITSPRQGAFIYSTN